MRNLPPRILVLSTFFAALATVISPVATPARAQTLPGPEVHPIKQLWRDANGITEDAEAVRIRSSYCRPPHQPTKAEPQAALDALQQQLQALKRLQDQLKRTFDQALTKGEMGKSTRAAFPKLDGLEADHRDYWANSNKLLTAAQAAIDAKQEALNRAPERDCSQTPPRTETIIGGNQPPVQPPPPPSPPPPPAPPVDPLKGLDRPISKGVNFPRLEKFYCSQAQKDAALALIPPEIAKVNANIADIDTYIASLRTRRGELAARGVEQHWLDSMDYAIRNAETEKASQATTIQALETTRRLIASTPIVDCATGKEIGSLPGNTLGASVEVGGAVGEVTIPEKPYLSIEDGGGLILGVVDHERTTDVAAMMLALAYDLDFMPNVDFASVRRQIWRATVNYYGYDFSVRSDGGSIATTTEGVGIPGTGDPSAANPAGVFLANPAFNDVTDIAFSHHSEAQSLKAGIALQSHVGFGTVDLGLKVGYERRETSDTLSANIAGFLTDLRYRTDVETTGGSLSGTVLINVPLGLVLDYEATALEGFSVDARAEGRAYFLDADGVDRLDLNGFINDTQRVRVSASDTTFGFSVGASLNYSPVDALIMSLGFEYSENDTHAVPHRSGQTGEQTTLDFETEEIYLGTVRTTFKF